MTFTGQSVRKVAFGFLHVGLCLATVHAQEPPSVETPSIIRKSSDALQASAIQRVKPRYPPLARSARVSGEVVVEVTVDEVGEVSLARAISGHPLLKESARTAARGWSFVPTKLDGVPVKVSGAITFKFDLGDQQENAIAAFREAIRLNPDDPVTYYSLGQSYDMLKRRDEALESYKEAVRIKPDFAYADRAYTFIGKIYFEKGNYLAALGAFKQGITVDATWADNYFYMGMTYLRLGDKESAMNEYRILKDKNQSFADELLKQIYKQP